MDSLLTNSNDYDRLVKVMDGYHKQELDHIKEKYLNNKKDFAICVEGVKGSGKSTWALQSCKYIDPSFNISRVHFFGESFLEDMKNIKQGQAIMLDEAVISMFRRNAMLNINKRLVIAFNIFRKKAAFIILCIPSIRNLDFSIQREHIFSLVHISDYPKKYWQLWKWYSRKRLLKIIYNKYEYKSARPNRWGFFYDFRPFEEEYEKKKDEAIAKFLSEQDNNTNKDSMDDLILKQLKMEKKVPEIAELIGITTRAVYERVAKLRKLGFVKL